MAFGLRTLASVVCAGATLAGVTPAFAQERFVECAAETRTIHEVAAQVAINDFHGTEQTVAGAAYVLSTCLGNSQNRFRLEASAAHVSERSYKADAFLLAAGFELHPFARHKSFIIEPMALVGQERLPLKGRNTILGASVILSDGFTLGSGKRSIDGKSTEIPVTQILLDGRADYVDRRTSNASGTVLTNNSAETTFYGAVAIDQEIGASRWKLTGRAAYQTLDSGSIDGFTTLSLGFRRENASYTNYGWTAQVGVNLGGNHYRALLLGVSLRFGGEAQKP